MNRKKLFELCRVLYLDVDASVISDVESTMDKFYQDLEILKSFDIEEVEPFFRIHEENSHFTLREDKIATEGFSQEDAFKNFQKVDEGFVVIQRVVDDQSKR